MSKLFKTTPADRILVVIAWTQVAALFLAFALFESQLYGWLAVLLVLMSVLMCTNYQCVAHNFIHNEFFNSRILNFGFSVVNTLAIGFPQSLYHEHHMNHHRYNNSPFAKDGVSPGDLSSTQRYSMNPGKDESLLCYAFLSPFRADFSAYIKSALRKGMAARVYCELSALVALWAVLLVASWKFVLFVYVPLVYFGHVLAYAETYFEHHEAKIGDRWRNSVSCYNVLYNKMWFNNGYHQEHHCYPQVHWTEIPTYKEKMVDEMDRKTVKFAHIFNI